MRLPVRNDTQVIHCWDIAAKNKGNASWRKLFSHLENKFCVVFLLLLQMGNKKKCRGWGNTKGSNTSFNGIKVDHSKCLFMSYETFTLTHIRCMYHYFVQLIRLKIAWKTNKDMSRFTEKL